MLRTVGNVIVPPEVMEIEDGLIRRHRVYWGWFGPQALEETRRR